MAFDVGAVVGHLQLRKDQWNQAIRDVKADQKSLSGLVLRNSQQFRRMGMAMTVAGGAIVGAFGLMVKAHAEFDQSMTESLAIMGDVSDKMKKDMAEAALEMSTKTTFSAKELGKAYFFLASAGMSAAQSIKALPIVAKFAQAGTFDLSLATDLLTDAQTALKLSSDDVVENQKNMIRISDVLVGANTLANASVKQFAEALTNKAAAALVTVNKEIEEGVAILAAFADAGIKGQLAGQRLTMMMNGLFDATRRNKKEWAAVGISLWDAKEQMRDFADIMGDLEDHLLEMTPEMRTAELATLGFNMRTVDSIKTLLGSSEKIRENTERLKEMGGITEEVAKKQLESLINQMTILKNTITRAAISVGETLGPALKNIIEDIKGAVETVAAWIKEHPKLTEVIAKSAIAVGALLLVLGPLLVMLPGVVAGMMLFSKSAKLMAIRAKVLAAANKILAVSFKLLLGPIGLVIIAAVALGTALNKLIDIYSEKQDAELEAMIKTASPMVKAMAMRKRLIADEIITIDEWAKIFNKHGRSYKRTLAAISKLPEYAHIREAWDKVIAKNKEAGKASNALTEVLRQDSNDVINLTTTMVDEIMRATLNEFEYRKWAAQTTYDERKALLEREKADKEAFVLLERAFAIELDGIEKDKTAKFKEGWAERGRAVWAGLQAWYDAEKATREKIQMLHAGYTDIIKEFTLSEKNYRLWQLDEWYATELVKLGTNLEAKIALQRAYALQMQAINDDDAVAQIGIIDKIGIATIMTLRQSKLGAIAQAVMSTYAGAAKSLEMFGMPLAIPFIAASIIAGLAQVAAITAVSIPSAEKGAYLPGPALVEAGHGRLGEVILPLDKAPGMSQKIVLQITTVVGEQTFYNESVKSINRAGRDGDITIPMKVVV